MAERAQVDPRYKPENAGKYRSGNEGRLLGGRRFVFYFQDPERNEKRKLDRAV